MAGEFSLEILTPARQVSSGRVSEVVLPAYDGECGILADHADFIGLLGTGVLKIVEAGKTRYLVVSSGVFRVEGGDVTVLADEADKPEEIEIEAVQKRTRELEDTFVDMDKFSADDYPVQLTEYRKLVALAEVYRRTHGS